MYMGQRDSQGSARKGLHFSTMSPPAVWPQNEVMETSNWVKIIHLPTRSRGNRPTPNDVFNGKSCKSHSQCCTCCVFPTKQGPQSSWKWLLAHKLFLWTSVFFLKEKTCLENPSKLSCRLNQWANEPSECIHLMLTARRGSKLPLIHNRKLETTRELSEVSVLSGYYLK